jgi:hypothetical protein
MPKLLDKMALAIALTACAPACQKPALPGLDSWTKAPNQESPLAVTAPLAANPANPANSINSINSIAPVEPDGYSCETVQNAVKNAVARCCLKINPYKACHEIENDDLEHFSNYNTVNLAGRPLPNYVYFKQGIPPAIYLKYLADSSNSATDLAYALTKFIKYRDINDDKLLPPEEIIAQGAGDCDNTANLFVYLLNLLSKKTSYDYKAKVVGLDGANHAVAIFFDTDGKWKALDMALPFNEIAQNAGKPDLFTASSIFQQNRKVGPMFYERHQLGQSAGEGARIDLFIDPATMMPNWRELSAVLSLDYDPRLNLDKLLSGYNWRQAKLAHLHFNGGVTAYYKQGELNQLTEQNKITFYASGKVYQIQYVNHPELELENFTEDGALESREFKNGTIEIFSNGALFQRLFKQGQVRYIVYYASGAVRQKNYRDGRVEWFDENGRMIKKKDRRGKVTESL